jgi:uncharacterized membrane protein YphA (DoxX/SURF4 family)
MKPAGSPACCPKAENLAVLARWLVGGFMIYMGLVKALDPVGFLKLVREYDLVQTPLLLNSIAAIVPWFETFCGLLLLAGVAVRGAALLLLAMLVPFTIIVLKRALALHAASTIAFCAVKFDCGCGMGEVYICHKLVENGLLILLSLWLLTGRGRRLAVRYGLLRPA